MLAVFENAHPPRVFRGSGHVIGNDVEKESEIEPFQFIMQRVEVSFGSELRIQRRGVDDVVSMQRAFAGAQNR